MKVVREREDENKFFFKVSIENSNFRVMLTKKYFLKLTGNKITPEELITKSFLFLLEREPKEMILKSFNLEVISSYFPEFERILQ
jgi:hypothetical protein